MEKKEEVGSLCNNPEREPHLDLENEADFMESMRKKMLEVEKTCIG